MGERTYGPKDPGEPTGFVEVPGVKGTGPVGHVLYEITLSREFVERAEPAALRAMLLAPPAPPGVPVRFRIEGVGAEPSIDDEDDE